MASSYFTIPSFNRAKKNKEDLEKTNPQKPVLKDEDEQFFDKEMRSGSVSEAAKEQPAVKITDDGEEKPLSAEEREKAVTSEDQTIIPETQPEGETKAVTTEEPPVTQDQSKTDEKPDQPDERPDSAYDQADGATYDDSQKEQAAAAVKDRKEKKKNKGMELPTQEEAEASTRGFNAQQDAQAQDESKPQGEKKTWASYLPAMRAKRPQSSDTNEPATPDATAAEGEQTTESQQQPKTTWVQYAGSYVPSLPNLTKRKKTDADATSSPVYNEDGTINEEATKEKQEREVSVLLDNLNLSSINNRVFAFSGETQQYYDRFLQCLKDVIAGGPTAYEDMDKLMKEAGPKLEEQWKTMPPFVQTLVKSLPMKMGPEVMAMASEKPDDELKKKLQGASTSENGGGAGFAAAAMNSGGESGDVEKGKGEGEQKKKRKIPALKSLVSGQGTVATLLRNTVGFVQTRFPFLASTTNVVMSLSVFSEQHYIPHIIHACRG